MDPLAAFVPGLLALIGVLYVARQQRQQNSVARTTEVTAAEVKGKTDTTSQVIDAWKEMARVQNDQISHLTNRLETMSVQLARCEKDKGEMQLQMVGFEVTLARAGLQPPAP